MPIKYIAHRINTLAGIRELPRQLGAEIDLRDHANRLILQHDPFTDGEDAEPFFADYKHGTLILNIKSERIEWSVLELMQKFGLKDFFFLDSSPPMIYQLAQKGERRMAVRFSEFETLDTALTFSTMVDWVWVDCFTKMPLSVFAFDELKGAGLKICMVSPELQGRPEDIRAHANTLMRQATMPDAICTKQHNIELWQSILGQ